MRKLLTLPFRLVGSAYRTTLDVYQDYKELCIALAVAGNVMIGCTLAVDWTAERAFERDLVQQITRQGHEEEMLRLKLGFAGNAIQYTASEIQEIVQRICAAFGDDDQVLERLQRPR